MKANFFLEKWIILLSLLLIMAGDALREIGDEFSGSVSG